MIEEKIKTSIEFTQELSDWFSRSLPDIIVQVEQDGEDPEFYNDEPLLTFTETDAVISEKRIKSKIAEMLLETHINDYIFQLEYQKSVNQSVEGYQ